MNEPLNGSECLEADSLLNQAFAAAADNPAEFDFSFAEEREEAGFANFGFDPEKAAAMRAAALGTDDADGEAEA